MAFYTIIVAVLTDTNKPRPTIIYDQKLYSLPIYLHFKYLKYHSVFNEKGILYFLEKSENDRLIKE